MEDLSDKIANTAVFIIKTIVAVSILRILVAALGYKFYIPYLDDFLAVTYRITADFVRWLSSFISNKMRFA